MEMLGGLRLCKGVSVQKDFLLSSAMLNGLHFF